MIRLGQTLLGVVSLLLLIANTLLWAVPIYTVIVAKLLAPVPAWQRACARWLTAMGQGWIGCNNRLGRLLQRTVWDVEGVDDLDPRGSYLVSSNHQSWIDVPVLQRVLNRRVPFLKFFVKRELIWVPILGGVWWAMDMPFMKRYSRAFLARHPERRGTDLEATRRSCARLLHSPVCIVNFLEGTRFTPAKQAAQQSSYRHLLNPRAGGAAFALAAMGGKIDVMLDVTVVYPDGAPRFWDFLCGRLSRIIVRVEAVAIPREFLTAGYEDDAAFRARFQAWIGALWARKDARIEAIRGAAAVDATRARSAA